VSFEDAGDQQLKNIARPVRTYRVRIEAPRNVQPRYNMCPTEPIDVITAE